MKLNLKIQSLLNNKISKLSVFLSLYTIAAIIFLIQSISSCTGYFCGLGYAIYGTPTAAIIFILLVFLGLYKYIGLHWLRAIIASFFASGTVFLVLYSLVSRISNIYLLIVLAFIIIPVLLNLMFTILVTDLSKKNRDVWLRYSKVFIFLIIIGGILWMQGFL